MLAEGGPGNVVLAVAPFLFVGIAVESPGFSTTGESSDLGFFFLTAGFAPTALDPVFDEPWADDLDEPRDETFGVPCSEVCLELPDAFTTGFLAAAPGAFLRCVLGDMESKTWWFGSQKLVGVYVP